METRNDSTESKGIMEQIRELLTQGRSSGEVIDLGFKSSTVWKVQRQMRRPKQTRQPKDRNYTPQGSYSGEQVDGSFESIWPQFVAIRDAVLYQAIKKRDWLPVCPACGEGEWEYYDVQDPKKPSMAQGFRCLHCHWAVDIGELKPRVRHNVTFASKSR